MAMMRIRTACASSQSCGGNPRPDSWSHDKPYHPGQSCKSTNKAYRAKRKYPHGITCRAGLTHLPHRQRLEGGKKRLYRAMAHHV